MAVIANTSPEVMEMVEKSAAKSSKRPAARTSTKEKDTKKPEPLPANAKLKEVNAYNRQMKTFLTNQAKWKAAKYEFNKRGCEFQVFTEIELSDKLHLF